MNVVAQNHIIDEAVQLTDGIKEKRLKIRHIEIQLNIKLNEQIDIDALIRLVRIAALKNIDTCGHNSGFTESMNCSGIYCNQCICLYPNNSVARRLIAKVENEMGK